MHRIIPRSFFKKNLFVILLISLFMGANSIANAGNDSSVSQNYSAFMGTWKGRWNSKYNAEFTFKDIKSDGTATVVYKREKKVSNHSTVNKESILSAKIKDGIAQIDDISLKLDPSNKDKIFGRVPLDDGTIGTGVFTKHD